MKAYLRLVVSTIVLIFCLIVLSSCTGQASSSSSSAELVSRAEHMLSEHGVTINDAKGDWVWTGNEDDNHSPYPVPWADLISATLAVDADYLYVRITVAGVYPRSEAELPWYGEDQVNKPGINIALDTDNNKITGCLSDKGAEVTMGVGMMNTPDGGWKAVYSFWYLPTGIEFPELRRYVHTETQNLVVAAWGGPGFDYCVFVLPAGLLGLYPGQTIAVIGWDESPSLKYPDRHATFDILAQGDKDNRIVIQLPK